MHNDLDRLLDIAIARHQSGCIDMAEDGYRAVLRLDPEQPDALNLLGLILHDKGQIDEAIALLERALSADPDFSEALVNLARAKRTTGLADDARALAERAIAITPDLAEAFLQLGLALYDLRQFDTALPILQQAATDLPHVAEIPLAIGNIHLARNEPADAIAAYDKTLRLQPDHLQALLHAGSCHVLLGQRDKARTYQEQAVDRHPTSAAAHAALALTLSQSGDIEGSLRACDAALAIAPTQHDALILRASNLLALGRLEEAEASYRLALAHFPHSNAAIAGLTAIGKSADATADIHHLQRTMEDESALWHDRATAGFALGRLHDRAHRYADAFQAYSTANKIVHDARLRQGRRFDPAALGQYVDWVTATFSPALFEVTRDWGHTSQRPIFIVGMPRSGTSLVEQIIASHNTVHGAGELRSIPDLIALLDGGEGHRSPLIWNREQISALTARHIETLAAMAPDAERTVDKLPDNVQALGQIAVLFPHAQIILCRRDIRDICLSCFFQNFNDGSEWTFDLDDCLTRAELIDRLAAHWLAVLPAGRVHVVDYENLVDDIEAETRQLLSFLGLAWDPACLAFHQTARTVKTASQWQVRQPLYQTSRGRWKHYAPWLEPYRDRFDALATKAAAGVDRPPIAHGDSAVYLIDVAKCHLIAGETEKATDAAHKAVSRDPNASDAHLILGIALANSGDQETALFHFRKAVALAPDRLDARKALADELMKRCQWNEARAAWQAALDLAPEDAGCLAGIAAVLVEYGLYDQAIPYYELLCALKPNDASVYHAIAGACIGGQYAAKAEEFARRACALEPDNAEYRIRLADSLSALGRFDDAMDMYKVGVGLDADQPYAIGALLAAGQSSDSYGDVKRLTAILADEKFEKRARASAGFAIASFYQKKGEYAEAFENLAQANRLVRGVLEATNHGYNRADTEAFVEWQMGIPLGALQNSPLSYGDPSEIPVFIVGLPRSGTSLVEQIIASHKLAHGLGETKFVDTAVGELMDSVTLAQRTAMLPSETRTKAAEVLTRMRAQCPTAERIVDKMPDNIKFVGQIALLFPNARIIFCKRDFRDTGLSCFFENFSDGLAWSFDLADMGFHFYQMERLRLYWKHILPLRMIEVQYEDLVADLDGQARRVIDFLGLDWDPACLDFHQNKRAVSTASLWQVRRPLYTSSVGRWRNYRRQLAPLIENLNGLVPIEPDPADDDTDG